MQAIQKSSRKLNWAVGVPSVLFGLLGITALLLGPLIIDYGDGAGAEAITKHGLNDWLPPIYCLLVAVSCLPFARGAAFISLGIALNIIFAVLMYQVCISKWVTDEIFVLLPFFGMEAGWIFLCKRAFKRDG